MNKTVAEIKAELEANGKVIIQGFGTFYTQVKKGREGVSAFNGKPYKTDDTVVVKFKQSASFDSSKFPAKY